MNRIIICKIGQTTHEPLRHFKINRQTPLGNPYVIGRDGTRKEVIAQYKEYFYTLVGHNKEITESVNEIYNAFLESDINLWCHCAPLPCHGEVIKEYLEERYKREHQEKQ